MEAKCSVEGCNNKHLAKGLCSKHYEQMRRHGCILKRTIRDLNEIIEYEDYAEMVLYDKNGDEVARTIIDLKDVDKVKICRWYMTPDGYVGNRGKNIGLLHRFIVNAPSNMVVDHINHNTLDNRKENLRICTQKQNMCNQSIRKDNKSGYTGVYFVENKNKWVAQIRINGKTKHLGYYNEMKNAVKARKEAEIKYFGEYRYKGEGK